MDKNLINFQFYLSSKGQTQISFFSGFYKLSCHLIILKVYFIIKNVSKIQVRYFLYLDSSVLK